MANEKISTQDMLEKVNEAIMAIAIGGQSYRIGSRQLTRATGTPYFSSNS